LVLTPAIKPRAESTLSFALASVCKNHIWLLLSSFNSIHISHAVMVFIGEIVDSFATAFGAIQIQALV
jgi:hypothetical protein